MCGWVGVHRCMYFSAAIPVCFTHTCCCHFYQFSLFTSLFSQVKSKSTCHNNRFQPKLSQSESNMMYPIPQSLFAV